MPPCRWELFISDLHLSAREPAIFERFLTFLDGPARAASRITILGDFFDAWAGDDDLADPFNTSVVCALRSIVTSGTPIDFMVGNRDFLIGQDFAAASGVSLLPDPCLREVAGIPTLLTHGDALCTEDADYQHFRARVRSPQWRADFLARPMDSRKREIELLRAHSQAQKRVKPRALMDVAASAVTEALRLHGAQAIIHGHTHRQGCHETSVDGRPCLRWVLGDWGSESESVLSCTPGHWMFAGPPPFAPLAGGSKKSTVVGRGVW